MIILLSGEAQLQSYWNKLSRNEYKLMGDKQGWNMDKTKYDLINCVDDDILYRYLHRYYIFAIIINPSIEIFSVNVNP